MSVCWKVNKNFRKMILKIQNINLIKNRPCWHILTLLMPISWRILEDNLFVMNFPFEIYQQDCDTNFHSARIKIRRNYFEKSLMRQPRKQFYTYYKLRVQISRNNYYYSAKKLNVPFLLQHINVTIQVEKYTNLKISPKAKSLNDSRILYI